MFSLIILIITLLIFTIISGDSAPGAGDHPAPGPSPGEEVEDDEAGVHPDRVRLPGSLAQEEDQGGRAEGEVQGEHEGVRQSDGRHAGADPVQQSVQ